MLIQTTNGSAAEQAGRGLLPADEAQLILRLRLLIARAANKDSLAWWDDQSLSPAAHYLLERLFPVAPPLAARQLALSAALARHVAAMSANANAVHLYRLDLDNRDRLALRFRPLLPVPVPAEPIASLDDLRRQLLELTDEPMPYKVIRQTNSAALQIAMPPAPSGTSPLCHRAKTFAWAYLEAGPRQARFPFILE